jgi:hypothetical protein
MHPHDPANAVATEASSRGRLRAQGMALTGGMKEDVVVEVVADRVGGRTGRWTACRMVCCHCTFELRWNWRAA